jgi:hypothetical protein
MKELLLITSILIVMSCGHDHSMCKNGVHIQSENEKAELATSLERIRLKNIEQSKRSKSDYEMPSRLDYKMNPTLKYVDPVGYMLTPSLF